MGRLLGLTTWLMVSMSALAMQPFNSEAFQKAQKGGQKILLHFHADWCPTCRAQQKTLSTLEKDGALKGITSFTVDYDKETDLKKQLKVTSQSSFIAFLGGLENGRVTGVTSESDIKAFLDKTLVNVTLNDQLRMMREASKIPPEKKKVMEEAAEKLRKSHLAEKVLKVGDTMPDFSLPNASGKKIQLSSVLKKGPVVIAFYRGSWCPYCNVQLNSYQQHLSEFKKRGATLLAITPEKRDLSVETAKSKKIEFDILTDKDNQLAQKLGLVFGVPAELKALYQQFGIDLEKSQGNPDWKLPVPATYIVQGDRKITYAFVDTDYTQRAEPGDLLKSLDGLK